MPIIDSPFITYKKPNVTDKDVIPVDLAMQVYKHIAKADYLEQIIIIENVAPPTDCDNDINVIEFTGTAVGRRGFIPL